MRKLAAWLHSSSKGKARQDFIIQLQIQSYKHEWSIRSTMVEMQEMFNSDYEAIIIIISMHHHHHPWKATLWLCMNKTAATSLMSSSNQTRVTMKNAKPSHQTQLWLIKHQIMCKRKHEVVNCRPKVMRKMCSMCNKYKPNTSKYTKNTCIRVNAKYHKNTKFRSLLESKCCHIISQWLACNLEWIWSLVTTHQSKPIQPRASFGSHNSHLHLARMSYHQLPYK